MANRLRQLLLAISMVGILTSGVWVFFPDAVDWVDWAARGVWMERIEVDMEEARQLRADGQLEAAEQVLADLVESMDGVQIGDRRDAWWRTVMRERIAILRQSDRFEDAIACARQYHEYAPRDADNTLALGLLLVRDETHAEEGLAILAELQRLVPEWSRVADAYAKALVARGRDREAVEVGLRFLRGAAGLQARDWMFFWDVGNSFEGDNSMRMDLEQLVEPGDYHVQVRIPPGEQPVKALRIDLPLWACVRLSDWQVLVRVGDQTAGFDKVEQLTKQSRIRPVKGNQLETRWESRCDLRFELDRPMLLDRTSRIELRAHLQTTLPPGTRQLFEDQKKAVELSKWLRDAGRLDDLALIRKAMGT